MAPLTWVQAQPVHLDARPCPRIRLHQGPSFSDARGAGAPTDFGPCEVLQSPDPQNLLLGEMCGGMMIEVIVKDVENTWSHRGQESSKQ